MIPVEQDFIQIVMNPVRQRIIQYLLIHGSGTTGEMKKELSDRKKHILCSAIEDYIKDASPITSGGVKDRHVNEVSTATLRNELNALESTRTTIRTTAAIKSPKG